MRILWLDLETTGLDPNHEDVLEVAAILTDRDLTPVAWTERVVECDGSRLDEMDDWCKKTHGESGLVDACLGPTAVPLGKAEDAVIALLEAHATPGEPIYLAGNSIHFDRSFIKRHMPRLDKALHYRMLDVSSLKIAWRDVLGIPEEKGAAAHRALDDVKESLKEFRRLISRVQK